MLRMTARESSMARATSRIAFHEHDVGSLLGDIGARTHRQADVSAGEGGEW